MKNLLECQEMIIIQQQLYQIYQNYYKPIGIDLLRQKI